MLHPSQMMSFCIFQQLCKGRRQKLFSGFFQYFDRFWSPKSGLPSLVLSSSQLLCSGCSIGFRLIRQGARHSFRLSLRHHSHRDQYHHHYNITLWPLWWKQEQRRGLPGTLSWVHPEGVVLVRTHIVHATGTSIDNNLFQSCPSLHGTLGEDLEAI